MMDPWSFMLNSVMDLYSESLLGFLIGNFDWDLLQALSICKF